MNIFEKIILALSITNPAKDFFVDLSNKGGNTFRNLFLFFIKILLPVAGVIAMFFVIYGGVQYVVSRGNDEAAEKGKKTLINAIIGVVIIVLSWVIIATISNALMETKVK